MPLPNPSVLSSIPGLSISVNWKSLKPRQTACRVQQRRKRWFGRRRRGLRLIPPSSKRNSTTTGVGRLVDRAGPGPVICQPVPSVILTAIQQSRSVAVILILSSAFEMLASFTTFTHFLGFMTFLELTSSPRY